MSLIQRRALAAAWGLALLLSVVPPARAQAPRLSFEAKESYKVWEHDPTDANRDQALRGLNTVERVGGPSDATSDSYDRMLSDLSGE